jgi:hypothetical protein
MTVTMTTLKTKEGSMGEPVHFQSREVTLGLDDDGDPITSLVIDQATLSATPPRANVPSGGNQRIVWDVLGELFRQTATLGKAGAPLSRPCVTIAAAIESCRGRLAVESKRHRERTMTAINGLVSRGCLAMKEDWLWCA